MELELVSVGGKRACASGWRGWGRSRVPMVPHDHPGFSRTATHEQAYAKELTTGLEARAPPFFVTAARIVLTKTPIGKVFDIFEDWRGARRRSPPPKDDK